jgi:multiple sugar transport system substrate-binding protein
MKARLNLKMKNRIATGGILLLCVLLTFAFASSRTIFHKEKIVLRIAAPAFVMNSSLHGDITDSQRFLQKAARSFEKTHENVSVDVRIFGMGDEYKAITECFGTSDAADVIFEGYFNLGSYVTSGRIVPLDDIITDEMRADIFDSVWMMGNYGGKTYLMPYLIYQNILTYRKRLFLASGLKRFVSDKGEIQNWTTAEWEEILDTLSEKLPPNVYPAMMYARNNQGDVHIMSLIRAFGSPIFNENGKFDFESDEAVKALAWIQSGVRRGWYPPMAENLEMRDMQELFENGQLAICFYNNASNQWMGNLDEYGFVNFPNNVATAFYTGFAVFDNGDAAKIKLAKEFVKSIYEDEELLEISVGNLSASKKMMEKHHQSIERVSEMAVNMENVVDFVQKNPNWQGTPTSVRSVFYPKIQELLRGSITPKECAAALDRDCNKAIEIGQSELKLHE